MRLVTACAAIWHIGCASHHRMLKFVKTGSDRIGVEETEWVSLLRA